jgi:hypothetical protein
VVASFIVRQHHGIVIDETLPVKAGLRVNVIPGGVVLLVFNVIAIHAPCHGNAERIEVMVGVLAITYEC